MQPTLKSRVNVQRNPRKRQRREGCLAVPKNYTVRGPESYHFNGTKWEPLTIRRAFKSAMSWLFGGK